ncbi:MAG: tetratricopeptide repeat protein [Nitrospira sp.]|nr:tetratricopeptide repeat protein [Nitrospira sp.]
MVGSKYWVVTYAYLSLGKMYDTLGEREKALIAYRKVLALKDFEHSHPRARKYLKIPYKPAQNEESDNEVK